MARELNGYGKCEGCGTDYSAAAYVYHCEQCDEPEPVEESESVDNKRGLCMLGANQG